MGGAAVPVANGGTLVLAATPAGPAQGVYSVRVKWRAQNVSNFSVLTLMRVSLGGVSVSISYASGAWSMIIGDQTVPLEVEPGGGQVDISVTAAGAGYASAGGQVWRGSVAAVSEVPMLYINGAAFVDSVEYLKRTLDDAVPSVPVRTGLLLADTFTQNAGSINGRAVEQAPTALTWNGGGVVSSGLHAAGETDGDYAGAGIDGGVAALDNVAPYVVSWTWTAGDMWPRRWIYPLLIYIGNAARVGFLINPDSDGVYWMDVGNGAPVAVEWVAGQTYQGTLAVAADGSATLNFLGKTMQSAAPELEEGQTLTLDAQSIYINVQASHVLNSIQVNAA